ncbi:MULTISPECIES: c-type cytochrome biogenesis protein CcsB [unclassified Salinibacterium]|uniref:c-type cytochrome biogenesis protein CcsB n=1 Tax=unclassified Salinibacterium TaxID=2632331 RepID=UPI001CD46B0A|nr:MULTISPECIES: c-type cytochrome biogenesis protein CcsB [unclassified Salinibacterium]
MTDTLAAYSLLAVYSAGVIYVIAFIVSMLDLARHGRGLELERSSTAGRVAFALTILGFIVHVLAVVLRGVAAGRAPWANMFEFAVTGTAVMVGVYLLVNIWRNVRYLNAYITGLVALLLMLAALNVYVDVVPLPPPLQSGWLIVHVFVATLGTGFFGVGAGIAIAQLLQERRERKGADTMRFLSRFPSSTNLENTSYWVNVVGFAFWTFTLIAGAIWAQFAWGRYWGWDTKEVWTFIIWVVYAGYIHARATRGWRGARSAWLSIIGFAAVLFNFTIVNLFFKGLHSYSGL